MKNYLAVIIFASVSALASLSLTNAQQQQKQKPTPPPDCPMMKDQDMKDMNERGDQAMGFSQVKTTHHFYLASDGGVIQVEANDSADTASRNEIRMHLAHIAGMFAGGNFEIPMFVHDQTPAGVDAMKELKTQIRYRYEDSARGGRVLIKSSDPRAIAAIHEFLRFQITEHKTGDALDEIK